MSDHSDNHRDDTNTTEAEFPVSRRSFLRGAGAGAFMAMGGAQIASFVAGSSPAQAADKPLTVSVIGQQMSAQSDQRSWAGFQQWLKDMGLEQKWDVTLTDAKGDPGQLVSNIQDAITRDVDAILVLFGTLTAARQALEDLKDSEIPFFSIDSGWQEPAIADLTSNNYTMGAKTSQFMVNRLLGSGKKEANIASIIANFHHGTRKRGKTLQTVLSENEWINVKEERVIQYSGFYETTQNAVDDWLTRYGDELDAIWCPWDEPAIAAAQVIKSHNLEDRMFVVGADGHPSAVDRMRDSAWPEVATAAQSFELWGAYSGWLINEIVGKGRSADELVPVPSVVFPAPLLVQGVNLPPKGTAPWKGTDLYYIYRERVTEGMS